jgi:hypothetical protein
MNPAGIFHLIKSAPRKEELINQLRRVVAEPQLEKA